MKSLNSIMKRVNLLFLIKAGIGSAVAIWLASSIGLLYSPSAGIITLLTLQNTKRETLEIALRRIISFFLAVFISYILFTNFGYNSAAFGGFVLVFVGFCIAFDLKDGISMNAVLMTHFLVEQHMDIELIVNEICILLLGMGIGILINFFMPKYREQIRIEQSAVEEAMKEVLRSLAIRLRSKEACLIQEGSSEKSLSNASFDSISIENKTEIIQEKQIVSDSEHVHLEEEIDFNKTSLEGSEEPTTENTDFARLDEMLEQLLEKAYEDVGNTLWKNTRYLVSYLEMRKHQVDVLKNISDNINQIPVVLRQSFPLADFMENTAKSYHELNNVKELLEELDRLNHHYKDEVLPSTREEFEYRAILFQILKQLEYFLVLKKNFVHELDDKDMKYYWRQ